jgi:hypothetical protein
LRQGNLLVLFLLLKGLTINKFSSKGNGDRKFQKLQST